MRNFLDNDGGLNLVTSKSGNGQMKQVASNFDYSATGDVRKMKLGNGLWETLQVDERFQLKQVGLGTTATNNNLFKVDYEYGELNSDGTTVDTSKNIGMIAKTTTTIPTTSFVQTFKYDAINRLTEAKELAPNNQQNWIQTFDYDRFGNRTQFSQTVGNTTLATNAITKPTIDQNNNQFTTGQGYLYDFNGNLIQDAEGRSFKFNGDDKQIEVKATNNPSQIIGNYFYDASGARVKKVVGNETTVFVYDAGGALAAEYSTTTPTTTPATSYMTTDHLGSPRVITDKNGAVISRRDFMPFGEEIYAGVGGRNTTQKYANFGSDNIRKRYTGYEKDDETQLDFAQARMYQNKHGRFTAVDPLMASASPGNPQTFNRYSYTGNNPINYTDPSGLSWCKDSNGNVAFSSGACSSEQENVDGKSRKITSGSLDATNGTAVQGDVVTFNSNGTARILNPLDPRDTVAYSDATNTTVTATADEIATTDASVSGSIGSDFASAYITLAENNGLSLVPNSLVPQYNQHTERGQAIGNGISIVQGACEIGSGLATACAGGVGDVLALAFPPAEAVTLTITAAGILEVTHGASVIGNTVYNSQNNQGSSSRQYDRPQNHNSSGKSVRTKDVTNDWDNFLGKDQTNIDPRDGLPDPDRIWSKDGLRSIRYGSHEMGSKPNLSHYHKETWFSNYVDNMLQRIQK